MEKMQYIKLLQRVSETKISCEKQPKLLKRLDKHPDLLILAQAIQAHVYVTHICSSALFESSTFENKRVHVCLWADVQKLKQAYSLEMKIGFQLDCSGFERKKRKKNWKNLFVNVFPLDSFLYLYIVNLGNEKIAALLLQHGGKVNGTNFVGNAPLVIAAANGSSSIFV